MSVLVEVGLCQRCQRVRQLYGDRCLGCHPVEGRERLVGTCPPVYSLKLGDSAELLISSCKAFETRKPCPECSSGMSIEAFCPAETPLNSAVWLCTRCGHSQPQLVLS